MQTLTRRQKELVTFIRSYQERQGVSPSYREILQALKLKSLGTIYQHVQILKRKGILQEEKGRRALQLREQASGLGKGVYTLPLVGYIQEGYPLELWTEPQQLAVPTAFVQDPQHSYLLQVKDQSFVSELIAKEDILIMEKTESIRVGALIVATLHQFDTVLRRYYKEDSLIRLQGHHTSHPDIYVAPEQFAFHGQVVGLWRHY